MKLVVGQNILIDKIGCVEIDFAWRSLESDLNLSIHAFAFNNGNVVAQSKVDPKALALPDNVSKDDSGRHFTVQFPSLAAKIDRIAFYGFLPEKSRYSLNKMSLFQIRVNDQHLGRIAKMNVEPFNEATKSALFFEFYKHNNAWKLGFKPQTFNTNNIDTLESLGLNLVKLLSTKTNTSVPSGESNHADDISEDTPQSEQHTPKIDFLDDIDLKKGQNISLSEHFEYCTAITCELNIVPKIDDIELNVIAINRDNKVNNIKDFLYRENTVLRGDGVKLATRDVLINLDKIPDDVTKIQLLVTRRSSVKRISSADFIELALTNTFTGQKIAKYISETTDKNYNTMVLLNFYRGSKGWSIRAVGQGFSGGLDKIGERYHFSPPKLRSVPKPPPLNQSVSDLGNDNEEQSDKFKKMQSLSYWLMGIAGLLSLLAFRGLLFLPLACVMGGAGWYFFQSASKGLKKLQHEKFERLVLTMIKSNNYYLTPFDIASNCQVNIDRATEALDDLCNKGLGHTAVNREGAIYYDFSSLKHSNR